MKKFLSTLSVFLLGSIVSLGIVYANDTKKFPDVDYSSYYGVSVNLMSSRGIMNGYENGNFGPNDAVTRAQLATILDRYDFSSPNYSRIIQLRDLICGALKKEELPLDAETWENVQEKYQSICEEPWYL